MSDIKRLQKKRAPELLGTLKTGSIVPYVVLEMVFRGVRNFSGHNPVRYYTGKGEIIERVMSLEACL
jgi:hypothetical protein